LVERLGESLGEKPKYATRMLASDEGLVFPVFQSEYWPSNLTGIRNILGPKLEDGLHFLGN
jgi:hypothetical protein